MPLIGEIADNCDIIRTVTESTSAFDSVQGHTKNQFGPKDTLTEWIERTTQECANDLSQSLRNLGK
ncbi:hypothetical protein NEOLI_003090 [Neolecta irregularis DAH-3]|uniref:Uncharacterized protein n=1 Tax=Neolecta irregularis (strain DAH-3) TaxID=1198029 RepID=A0A1U7LWP8_NEOID|nr:hypothetical protein NEOLI_003090 [Neolecta irregularis DAH-3]|eukprot:OLL27105.1 hypothetical protein NEOLI_003090 [Neolecta irregularis DAH-3]